jgi:hypothetical protein
MQPDKALRDELLAEVEAVAPIALRFCSLK